jgi:hypothetical protein
VVSSVRSSPVGSKLKCPLFVASEMSGFQSCALADWVGLIVGMGLQGKGAVPLPLLIAGEALAGKGVPPRS